MGSRRGASAQHEQWIRSRGVGVDMHLAVSEPKAFAEGTGPLADSPERAAERRANTTPGVIAGPGDQAGCLRDASHQRVGVDILECGRNPILLLQQQDLV